MTPLPALNYRSAVVLAFALALGNGTQTTWAHGGSHGPPHGGEQGWNQWNWDPLVLSCVALVAGVYALGLYRLWSRTGVGGGIGRRHALAYAAGVFALIIALLSPVDVLSDELSWMHMIQHMVLMNVAAPLMVLGAPALVALWALPLPWRHRLGRWQRGRPSHGPRWYFLWQPLLLWTLYAGSMWIWHVPQLYNAALHNEAIHHFQHLTFFIASCLFWRVLLDPISRLRLSRGLGVVYLFATTLHATLLGVFMALAPSVWYPFYEGRTLPWGVTALEDQQLAGLIMWMPACMVYAAAAAIIFGLWLNEQPPVGKPVSLQHRYREQSS